MRSLSRGVCRAWLTLMMGAEFPMVLRVPVVPELTTTMSGETTQLPFEQMDLVPEHTWPQSPQLLAVPSWVVQPPLGSPQAFQPGSQVGTQVPAVQAVALACAWRHWVLQAPQALT